MVASAPGSGGPGKWPVKQDTPGWPAKLERACSALRWCPGDARRGFKAIAACGSLALPCLGHEEKRGVSRHGMESGAVRQGGHLQAVSPPF